MHPVGSSLILIALMAAGLPAPGRSDEPRPPIAPVLVRSLPLPGVRGPADRTGIAGRIDHMAFDPATNRLFVACVANGSLEVVDVGSWTRSGSVSGLRGPQAVRFAGGFAFVTTGDDGKLHRFDARTLAGGNPLAIGDDADNIRVGPDGRLWVSFGGEGPGGLACVDGVRLLVDRKLGLARMPEGFQVHPAGRAIYANLPAGKRSTKDGSVIALRPSDGSRLWERTLTGRAGNFPMALDPAHDRLFVVSRRPPRLIGLDARDGSILGEAEAPPESDDLFLDTRTGRLAVIGGGTLPEPGSPGGAGASVDLFAIDRAGRPSRVGGTPLPPHTRTGTMVEGRRSLYVAVPAYEDRPAELREYRLPD